MDINTFTSRYLEQLNPQQREAVLTLDGKFLLLATPGSGKTTVLVTRLGYMICCKGVDPRSILTVTYTRAATFDMKRRFAALFGDEAAAPVEFRTINGLSQIIVNHFWRIYGVPPYTLLENEGEINTLLRRLYQEVNDEYPEDGTIKEIRTAITYIKNSLLSDEEIERYESRVESLPELYRRYQQALRERRLMDYDDQMAYALNILRRSPQLLAHYRAQFRWLCVDEAQDTSKVQHEIIKLLAGEDGNLFMVGDEDQSIYGFRAAYPEALLHFEEDHPGARVLLMEENYRSTQEITRLADHFIARNISRHEKSMHAVRLSGAPVRLVSVREREMQYAWLLETARRCERETAILFRNNDSALPLIDAFERAGIAYNCRNFEDTFFNHRIVNDMQNVLRFAAAPTDEALFMQLYYKFGAPITKASAQEAVRRSKCSGQPILRELIHAPDVRGPAQDIAIDLAEMLPQLPADSAETALHRIWDGMHYGRYVQQKKLDAGKYFILCQLAKGVENPVAYLDKLAGLQGKISQHQNSPANKFTLSTIHSSKGLEYDRVYLLDVLNGILPSVSEEEIKTADDRKLYEEERRLFYVAMTRAKNELYLFDCPDADFTAEAQSLLPSPLWEEDELFSSLSQPLIGKRYPDREFGLGVIHAQCGEHCLVHFPGGRQELLTLAEMLSRRAEPTMVNREEAKARKPKANTSGRQKTARRKSAIKPGKSIKHRSFGVGVVQEVNGDIVTVNFPEYGTRKLVLSVSLEHGMLV